MDVRAQQAIPDQQRGQAEIQRLTLASALNDKYQRNAGERDAYSAQRNAVGVEERDDQGCDEVVDDGDSEQQHAQRIGYAWPEQGQHANCKGDVGGGRYRPTAVG